MPFGLKNTQSEFQNIMNDIILPISSFAIVYIDDVLIFSKSINEHFKYLNIFYDLIFKNGLVVSASKMSLFQTQIRFLGHEIINNTIRPIQRRKMKPSKISSSSKSPQTPESKKKLVIVPYSNQTFPSLPTQNRFSPIANSPTFSQLVQMPNTSISPIPFKRSSSSSISPNKPTSSYLIHPNLQFRIIKVLSLSDWKARPYTQKALSNWPQNPSYNYYDYQDAWYNVLYLSFEEPLQVQAGSISEEEELRLLMSAPTKEEMRKLLRQIKDSQGSSSDESIKQEDTHDQKTDQDACLGKNLRLHDDRL
ncbi:hypothetical protein OSB04_007084 [Centaurea solstitialis]|uniref:Reverse transcriptase domain-containing protein n=1 Tax=Centaurea solstitialis TaxID=347529 RepID=A0AA38TKZ9_9ASTR|nr:hypothetical protein OSB04_007084 [Centaurea solstitialis]